jgi:ribosomal protein S18 acetylase RimI-like enzyme
MPDPAAVVREYRDDDAPEVTAAIVELQEFERRLDGRLRPGDAIAAEFLARMLARCRDYTGTILVAECAGLVAGFATVLARVPYEEIDDPAGEYALITDLVVREAFRRRGLGRALLREAERHARAAGATELRVGVLAANDSARRLYFRTGFAPYLETLTKRLTAEQEFEGR